MSRLVLLAVALSVPAALPGQAGDKDGKGEVRIRYDFSETMQVGFELLGDKGAARKITFDPKGGTNITVLRIDGRDYAFGFEGGVFGAKKTPLKDKRGLQTLWKVDAIEVTQTVEVVPSKTGKLDACVVRYTVVNKDPKKTYKIGVRVLLDTCIDMKDNHAFATADLKQIITTQADYRGDKMPAVMLAIEKPSAKDPGMTAVLTLKVGDLEKPDRFSITTFPERDTAFGWEIPVKDIGKDAAVAIYWEPAALAPAASRQVGYGYGAGAVE